ncbi:hypothetical protein HMPREF1531_02098 [Propionibacterium sp. oral taxon 192 str. F0372]|uniref:prephenate dehydrogenase n=1 Tax=Propionibacterium sp. oral taxon 192 TaxID=671222 RepID=UPI000353DF5A|nr:prephenate dehydrogenase [Propionibacterium sp. oral taxon 192]EPH02787.1 hypothetical protein HMPREF1531_02098 [Propionibacterium sp. oral taxon 192 str. F0372]
MTGKLSPCVVIGTGLLGASIGCALTSAGVRVHLVDKDPSHAVVAASRGAGTLDDPVPEKVQLVIVATPPLTIPIVVTSALANYPYAVVTDTGSVKQRIARELETGGVDVSRYVGGHPMAGSHHAGPLTAAGDMFRDRTWVITPTETNPDWVVERVRELAATCRARIVEMDAGDHDRAVAEVSHFPQLVSTLTAARLAQVPSADLRLAGQGVRDVTRIAASDVEMWRQIVLANTDNIRAQLMGLREDLDELLVQITDSDVVARFLVRGNRGVEALPEKSGKRRTELVAVTVEIPDEPGALARMMTDVTAMGVNIEDLSIEHDPDRDAGYLSIKVSTVESDRLRKMLRDNGAVLTGEKE